MTPVTNSPRAAASCSTVERVQLVGRVVVALELVQEQRRPVVHLHLAASCPGSYSTAMSSKNGTKLISPSGSSWSLT